MARHGPVAARMTGTGTEMAVTPDGDGTLNSVLIENRAAKRKHGRVGTAHRTRSYVSGLSGNQRRIPLRHGLECTLEGCREPLQSV